MKRKELVKPDDATMIGENGLGGNFRGGNGGMTDLTPTPTRFRGAILSLDFLPLTYADDIHSRPDLIAFPEGLSLSYIEATGWNRYKPKSANKNFKIGVREASTRALFKYNRFRDWDEFVEKSEKSPILQLLLKCTNICPELFEMAKENYAIQIPIGFDIIKYRKLVGGTTSFTSYEQHQWYASQKQEKRAQLDLKRELTYPIMKG